jgi:hypothetical protein
MRLILIIGFLLLNLQAKSLFSNDAQKENSIYISNLKELILATQKTRGLTNSYLNGNTAALLLVYNSRSDIKKAIGKMESTTLATDVVINSRASDISKSLIKLNSVAFKQAPKKTFSDYTQQIEQILMLAQTISQRTSKDLNPFGKEASSVMMNDMLPLTEYVGQLRGYGSGVAARGVVKKSDIEQVYLLVNEMTTYNNTLQDEMSNLLNKYSGKLPKSLREELVNINKQVEQYQYLASKKLLKSPKDVDSDLFFEKGTMLIKAIVKAYNSCNRAILEDSKGWL